MSGFFRGPLNDGPHVHGGVGMRAESCRYLRSDRRSAGGRLLLRATRTSLADVPPIHDRNCTGGPWARQRKVAPAIPRGELLRNSPMAASSPGRIAEQGCNDRECP